MISLNQSSSFTHLSNAFFKFLASNHQLCTNFCKYHIICLLLICCAERLRNLFCATNFFIHHSNFSLRVKFLFALVSWLSISNSKSLAHTHWNVVNLSHTHLEACCTFSIYSNNFSQSCKFFICSLVHTLVGW